MPATLANLQHSHSVLQALPRRGWVLWLLVATGCGSRTSLNEAGTNPSANVAGATSKDGVSGQGVGGNAAGAKGTGGTVGSGGLTGSDGVARTGGVASTGGTVATGGVIGRGGSSGTGGIVGSGGLTGSGRTTSTGGVTGTGGGVGTGGTEGTGGSSGRDGGGASCSNVTPCGGDAVGTWTVTSSCLNVTGQVDMSMLGLGCMTAAVTGSLWVTGTWTANSDGTYSDNTITSGNEQLALPASCLQLSGTTTTCDRLASLLQLLGYAVTNCISAASGGCACSATVNQTGAAGVVTPDASTSGNYTTSGNVVTLDREAKYSYCVSGNRMTLTPQSTSPTTMGTVVFQKSGSTGSGGATGGTKASGGTMGTGGTIGSGGAVGRGGTTGSGGMVGTSGTIGSGDYGTPCTTNQDCASYATCCDGSNQSCDGTRLPAGDGANTGEFVVNGDGLTVTDTITGLVWQRDGSGSRPSCASDPECTWAEAKAYCSGLTLGGLSGWRLPAVMELRTIVDFTTIDPVIDPTAFPNTPGEYFWTSSPCAGSSGDAWNVYFGNGHSDSNDVGNSNRVRCVR